MLFIYLGLVIIVLYIICDVNYVIRTYFTVLLSQRANKVSLLETTSFYDIGTLQDCDTSFRSVREARILRTLDFARYDFYIRTGIYVSSRMNKIRSLQGCTFTIIMEPIPLFKLYRIDTKLVYWDEKSLFLEHKVVTLNDGRVRCLLLSRQHALGKEDPRKSTEELLKGLRGSEVQLSCPDYIRIWLHSIDLSSAKWRK